MYYTNTKFIKQNNLLFIIIFILNFRSLNTFDRDDPHYIEISTICSECSVQNQQNSSAIDLSEQILSQTNHSSDNSSKFDIHLNKNTQQPLPIRTDSLNYFTKASFDYSITFRSVPNLVLLDDESASRNLKNRQQHQTSRKKQLDSDSINVKSILNYRLDDTQTEMSTNDKTNDRIDAEKQKLKQNIDKHLNSDIESIKDSDRTSDRNFNKTINRTSSNNNNTIIDKQFNVPNTHMRSTKRSDEQLKKESNQMNETITATSTIDRPSNEHRSRRINELNHVHQQHQQINRRIKNPRPNFSAVQSSYSMLRKFYPINHINQLANSNKYTVEDAKLATLEIVKVQRDGRCKFPTKRIIPIYKLLNRNQFLKKILPHCTILHRCETETGCCNSDSEHCTVKNQEDVKLPFWTIQLAADGQQFKSIEWFTFTNHTGKVLFRLKYIKFTNSIFFFVILECECRPRS